MTARASISGIERHDGGAAWTSDPEAPEGFVSSAAGRAPYGAAATFLSVQDCAHVACWTDAIGGRPAAKRAVMVNKISGEPDTQLRERRAASDFADRA